MAALRAFTMEKGNAEETYVDMIKEFYGGSKSKEDTIDIYSKWENYEQLIIDYAPNRPSMGAAAFEAEFGHKNDYIRILDAGAGTGLAAEALMKLGYTNIDALEPCESLAKKALEKNIYKNWYKAYMCKDRLPIDSDVYDAVYSVGAFGPAHAKEDSFEELIRVLKPGGKLMILTGEGYLGYPCMQNFEPKIRELEKQGVLIYRRRDILPNYITNENEPMNGLILLMEKPYAFEN